MAEANKFETEPKWACEQIIGHLGVSMSLLKQAQDRITNIDAAQPAWCLLQAAIERTEIETDMVEAMLNALIEAA